MRFALALAAALATTAVAWLLFVRKFVRWLGADRRRDAGFYGFLAAVAALGLAGAIDDGDTFWTVAGAIEIPLFVGAAALAWRRAR